MAEENHEYNPYSGSFDQVYSSCEPLEIYLHHLRHLAVPEVVNKLLLDKFKSFNNCLSRSKQAKLIASHINLALDFYYQSKIVSQATSPVLKYYSYLNFASALILAERPKEFEQYRKHGVTDKTANLSGLNLDSGMLAVHQKGAIPLFHSILSDAELPNSSLSLQDLTPSCKIFSYELNKYFDLQIISNAVSLGQVRISDERQYIPIIKFHSPSKGKYSYIARSSDMAFSEDQIHAAMPVLLRDYEVYQSAGSIVFESQNSYQSMDEASKKCTADFERISNFGGHSLVSDSSIDGGDYGEKIEYCWYGTDDRAIFPTLTSILLVAFGFSSISRYRPELVHDIQSNKLQLIYDIFLNEADSLFIPAIRNLLYKEMLFVKRKKAL